MKPPPATDRSRPIPRPAYGVFAAAALAVLGAAARGGEIFYSETADEYIKIELEGGREVRRWTRPKTPGDADRPAALPPGPAGPRPGPGPRGAGAAAADSPPRPAPPRPETAAPVRPRFGRSAVLSGGMRVVWIPRGAYLRGSPRAEVGRARNEGPLGEVRVAAGFWAGATEVTQAQYEAVAGRNPSRFRGPDRPVERVTWEEARAFCRDLTAREAARGALPEGWELRLPSETEWEYFARAETATATYAGDLTGEGECRERVLNPVAWYCGTSGTRDEADHDAGRWSAKGIEGYAGTHPVGAKRPNAWGLFDTLGNVSEWCLDAYFPGYDGAAPGVAPQGATEVPGRRVIRGGGWMNAAPHCRAAWRRPLAQDLRNPGVGFRVVLAPARTPMATDEQIRRLGDLRIPSVTDP